MSTIRPPAAAGSFYPAQANRLRETVESLLSDADGVAPPQPAKAVIAPHAGYIYSGAIAGKAFATLGAASSFLRAVVVGPAHFVPHRGLAVPTVDAFRTPLGDVRLDRDAIAAISDLPQVHLADAPHQPEHAIEVELPFLQTLLGDFSLVPLVVGDAPAHEVAQVLDRLWNGPDSMIVISSDLSHYEEYQDATNHDAATAAAIERFDDDALGPRDACGYLPIAGLLIEARRRGLTVQRLDLRNSGDTAGPKDQVVGYGAWAFH